MKAFLTHHWEKAAAGLAAVVLALSLAFNLALVQDAEVLTTSRGTLDALNQMTGSVKPMTFEVPPVLTTLQEGLARSPGVFPIPGKLMNYPLESNTEQVVNLNEGGRTTCPVDPFTGLPKCDNPAVAEVLRVPGEEDLPEASNLLIIAKQAGKARVTLTFHGRKAGTFLIQVRALNRVELWPPVLTGATANPQNPGEVTVQWRDHERTSLGVTAGYILERRAPAGHFENVLGPGRMLPAGSASYVDAVEPGLVYEYRVIAVGDATVTHVMEP